MTMLTNPNAVEQLAVLPADTTFDESMSVVVRNNSTTSTYTFQYNKTRYTFGPNETKLVPWFAMCTWFGDPRSVDKHPTKTSLQFRRKERDRMRVKWGLQGQSFYADGPETFAVEGPVRGKDVTWSESEYVPVPASDISPNAGRHRHPNLPDIRVYDLQTGHRILTVLDDPEHAQAMDRVNTKATTQDLEAQILNMQATQQTMLAMLTEKDPETAAKLAAQLNPEGPGQAVTDDLGVPPTPSTTDPDLDSPTAVDPDFTPDIDESPAADDEGVPKPRRPVKKSAS